MFERLQVAQKVSLDLRVHAAATFSFYVDGALVKTKAVSTGGLRSRVEIRLPSNARGFHVRAKLDATGAVRLYAASVWARGLGASGSDWAWRPLPVRVTADEWASRRVPIRPTSDDWTSRRVPIRPTSDDWQESRMAMPAAQAIRQFVNLPVDA